NAELEEKLAQRTEQLAATNSELEAFAYSVSHDLRSPLRAVDGYAQMFQEDYGAVLDEVGRRLLNMIRDNSRRMGTLIDAFLAFSRMARQPMTIGVIDMSKAVEEAWSEVLAAWPGPKPSLSIQALPSANADRPLLKQVWIHLLSNAVKYSARREHPRVEIR